MRDYGHGEPGARGKAISFQASLPEEAWDFFGEMAASFNRDKGTRLTIVQFVEQYLLSLSMADKRRDPAITHRLRKRV